MPYIFIHYYLHFNLAFIMIYFAYPRDLNANQGSHSEECFMIDYTFRDKLYLVTTYSRPYLAEFK